MTTKLEQAARALLAHWDTPAWKYEKPTADLIGALREALADFQSETGIENNQADSLKDHIRDATKMVSDHIADAGKMVLDDPHQPHRLCECTACLEYWTEKPACDQDAFADAGKVIEQDCGGGHHHRYAGSFPL